MAEYTGRPLDQPEKSSQWVMVSGAVDDTMPPSAAVAGTFLTRERPRGEKWMKHRRIGHGAGHASAGCHRLWEREHQSIGLESGRRSAPPSCSGSRSSMTSRRSTPVTSRPQSPSLSSRTSAAGCIASMTSSRRSRHRHGDAGHLLGRADLHLPPAPGRQVLQRRPGHLG